MATAYPGVEPRSSYGTPGLYVGKKFMSRLREPDVMVLTPVHEDEQRFLMETSPVAFFLTDHYRGYPTILIRLSKVQRGQLAELIEESWRRLARPKLLAQLEGAASESKRKATKTKVTPAKKTATKKSAGAKSGPKHGLTWEVARDIALAYPGMATYPPNSPDATQVRLGKKHLIFMSREPGALCLRPLDEVEQRLLMETQPDTYFLTDHYLTWSCILIRLAKVQRADLAALIDQSWRRMAPKKAVAAYDASRATTNRH